MKKTLLFMVAGAAILFTACNKELEVNNPEENQENGPVYITANIDSETKATLANDNGERAGVFAFSSGDAIMVCNDNESGAFSGNTTSTGNSGTFAMDAGFDGSSNGIAGFPASLVSAMTKNSVTFTLPTSYEYSEVGGTDPSAAKVPCPMIGSYDGETKQVTLKQAGAVVRFRVTNINTGALTFTFPTLVTGTVVLNTVPRETNDGILATGFITGDYVARGNIITINNVPDVTDGDYIFITLPVPTATAPQEILVTNTPSDGSKATRLTALTGSSSPLNRAGGYKISARPLAPAVEASFKVASDKKVVFAPGNLMAQIENDSFVRTGNSAYASASKWKFGDFNEYIGGAEDTGNYLFGRLDKNCEGKWVDLFCWQGQSTVHKSQGLVSVVSTDTDYFGTGVNESLYDGCWSTATITITNGGGYNWRPLTQSEWNYLLFTRNTSVLDGTTDARCTRAKVAGVNGLLIFPDNVGSIWNTTTMGDYPNKADMNGDSTSSTIWDDVSEYTASNMVAMANAGFAFLPCAGYRGAVLNQGQGKYYGVIHSDNTFGYYWSSTPHETVADKAVYLEFRPSRKVRFEPWTRYVGRSVRLVREVPVE